MNRYYVSRDCFRGDAVEIRDVEDLHHLVKVLRIRPGESLHATDGQGGFFETRVVEVAKNAVRLKIIKALSRQRRQDRKVRLTIACAIPRYAHFEEIVDKATQLGADEIIAVLTERTQVPKETFEKKRERYERIMVAAAKQSGALFLPELKPATDFRELLKDVPRYGLALIPHLSGAPMTLPEALRGFESGRILVLIGPEGDFTNEEIKAALATGAREVTLGPSVLRVDTAAIAVLSFLRLMSE